MKRKKQADDSSLSGTSDNSVGTSRRTVLKNAGFTALGLGVAAAIGGPLVSSLAGEVLPARTRVPGAKPLRVDNVTVVDPRDGSKRSGVSVLVRGGRIVSVGAASSVTAAGLRVIDGGGRFIVPGYNNMHTHVFQEQRSSLFMATMLREGTTGMRQMAGPDAILRNRAQGRLSLGMYSPQLLSMSGAILMPFNSPTIARVRHEISRQKELGADFIKLIMVERDVFFEAVSWAHANGLTIGGHLPPSVTPSEASNAGYDFMEHLGTSGNIWNATSADRVALEREADPSMALPNILGFVPFADQLFSSDIVTKATAKTLLNPALADSAEYVALLQRALDSFDRNAARTLASTFAKNGAWQTPTLSRLRTEYRMDAPEYKNHPWLKMISTQSQIDFRDTRAIYLDLPAAHRSAYHQYYDTSLKLVKIFHDAGVPIMTGTDGPGGNPGQDMKSEFTEMAVAGLSPLDILRATTTAPAAFLGRSHRMGAVDTGMEADFLLLDADPLAHVDNLGKINAVVRGGRYLTVTEIDETVDKLLESAEA